jgi:hypothetical protein
MAGRDIDRWQAEIDDLERGIVGLRAKIDVTVLERVESLASANFLEQAGFRVDRTDDGTPRVAVDRVLADPPGDVRP